MILPQIEKRKKKTEKIWLEMFWSELFFFFFIASEYKHSKQEFDQVVIIMKKFQLSIYSLRYFWLAFRAEEMFSCFFTKKINERKSNFLNRFD